MASFVILWVSLVFLGMTALKQPFSFFRLNQLEVMSLLCSVVSVYMALFFMEDSSDDPDAVASRDVMVLSEEVKMSMFLIIVSVNVSFVLNLTVSIYIEIVNQIKKRLPSLYVSLWMCGNKTRFNRLLEKEKYLNRFHDMIENIDDIIDYYQFMKN